MDSAKLWRRWESALVFEHIQPVVGPYVPVPLACREPNPRAVDVARAIARAISDNLPQIRVEHVGSTAVPGCAGSGVVDLAIPVADDLAETLQLLLARLGFQAASAGETLAAGPAVWSGDWTQDGQTLPVCVRLFPIAAPEIDEMRFFRTCLRADPELLRAYVERKRELLAAGAIDPAEYARLKAKFVQSVLG